MVAGVGGAVQAWARRADPGLSEAYASSAWSGFPREVDPAHEQGAPTKQARWPSSLAKPCCPARLGVNGRGRQSRGRSRTSCRIGACPQPSGGQ
jgi:hypothetical protein